MKVLKIVKISLREYKKILFYFHLKLLPSLTIRKKNAFSSFGLRFIIRVSKSGGKKMTTFKDGFLWGGAVVAHQLEGGCP